MSEIVTQPRDTKTPLAEQAKQEEHHPGLLTRALHGITNKLGLTHDEPVSETPAAVEGITSFPDVDSEQARLARQLQEQTLGGSQDVRIDNKMRDAGTGKVEMYAPSPLEKAEGVAKDIKGNVVEHMKFIKDNTKDNYDESKFKREAANPDEPSVTLLLKEHLIDAPKAVVGSAAELIRSDFDVVAGVASSGYEGLKHKLGMGYDASKDAAATAGKVAQETGAIGKEKVKETASSVADRAKDAKDYTKDTAESASDKTRGVARSVYDGTKDAVKSAAEKTSDVAYSAEKMAEHAADSIRGSLTSGIHKVEDATKSAYGYTADTARSAADKATDAMKSAYDYTAKSVSDTTAHTTKYARDSSKAAYDSAADAASSAYHHTADAAKSVIDKAEDATVSAYDATTGAAKGGLGYLKDTATSAASKVADTATDYVHRIEAIYGGDMEEDKPNLGYKETTVKGPEGEIGARLMAQLEEAEQEGRKLTEEANKGRDMSKTPGYRTTTEVAQEQSVSTKPTAKEVASPNPEERKVADSTGFLAAPVEQGGFFTDLAHKVSEMFGGGKINAIQTPEEMRHEALLHKSAQAQSSGVEPGRTKTAWTPEDRVILHKAPEP